METRLSQALSYLGSLDTRSPICIVPYILTFPCKKVEDCNVQQLSQEYTAGKPLSRGCRLTLKTITQLQKFVLTFIKFIWVTLVGKSRRFQGYNPVIRDLCFALRALHLESVLFPSPCI